jgi:predicted ATPase/transcriptional regulator with XRE-family HTH domain
MDQTFGKWVKRRRKALDLTQQQLAHRVGCSLATIIKIEAEERRPSRQIAELLAQELDLPPDQHALFLKIARQEKGLAHLDTFPPAVIPIAPPPEQPKSNLPAPLTPLIGREHEAAMLVQQLLDPACRLLTLTGPGGVGKSRLALEAAHQVQDAYPQGVFFVPLAGTAYSEFILPAIAEAVGFTFTGAENLQVQLFHFLGGKCLLLVLDNLEQLLQGIEILSDLLQQCPQVKILATSREPLNLRIEWAVAVQGLPVPSGLQLTSFESNSAVALFVQRARQAKFGFVLSEVDLPDVERICRLVEGLPLGLEIAASWVRTLSCREIAREIENSLDFLTTSSRDVPQRHHSLRAVFDYSWTLLTPEEQQGLMKLSVFKGGFTREAAGQVADAGLPLLTALVDKSLVGHAAGQRYELHELVRQYAHEQLVHSGQLEAARDRHLRYFLTFAEESRSRLRSSSQTEWLNRLEDDHDNLRAALEWSLRHEHTEDPSEEQESAMQASFQFAGALYVFWRLHNHWSEGRNWLQRILRQPARQTVTRERARALNALVLLSAEQADLKKARYLAEQNLELARELREPHILARAHHARGIVLWKQKDFAAAHESCEMAAQLFRGLGNRPALAASLQALGRIAMNQDKLDLAQVYLNQSEAIFQEFSNTIERNAVLSDLGLLAYLQNDFAAARSYLERSLQHFRAAGNHSGIEMSLNRLGDVARCEGDYPEAERLYAECMAVYGGSGDQDEIASLLHNQGYVASRGGDQAGALELFRQALSMQQELDNQAGMAECLSGIAGVLTLQSHFDCAARLFGAAEALREATGVVLWPANRMEYERSLVLLQNSMEPEKLKAAWARGRSLPLAQSVQEAFGANGQDLLEPPPFAQHPGGTAAGTQRAD